MKKSSLFFFLCLSMISGAVSQAQTNADTSGFTYEKVVALGPAYEILRSLEGNWNVQQTIYPSPDAKPITEQLVARRKLNQHFLEEVIQPAGHQPPAFTRTAYFNYNNANQHWEYIVLDTRYPVMMFETSVSADQTIKELTLFLPAFVLPPAGWDKKLSGQLGKQRRTITFESTDRTVMRQYWTVPGQKEFLAMEYIYTRQK